MDRVVATRDWSIMLKSPPWLVKVRRKLWRTKEERCFASDFKYIQECMHSFGEETVAGHPKRAFEIKAAMDRRLNHTELEHP